MARDSISVTDNRTGSDVQDPDHGRHDPRDRAAADQGEDDDFGLMSYDPAFLNTASCRSAVTFIDGDDGILRYRGYPIEQLAEE